MIAPPDYSDYTLEELKVAHDNWIWTKLGAEEMIEKLRKLIEEKEAE